MKHDIFIDNTVASKFANPADEEYKKLIRWLMENHEINVGTEDDRAYLVVSKKLLAEYYRSNRDSAGATSIPMIIKKMTQEGRLVPFSNEQIKEFQKQHFTKAIEKKMQSNVEDRDHIPPVLMSDRKYALTYDNGLIHDLETFPGYMVLVRKRPEEIPYK